MRRASSNREKQPTLAQPLAQAARGLTESLCVALRVRSDKQLIDEGKITDQEFIADYYKKQDTIKTLREEYAR